MRVELDESACAMAVDPVSPISLLDIFNVVRKELDESARAIDAASLIRLVRRSNVVRAELDDSARTMDAAPVVPI